jgi:Tfp pilus assembly protein PilF
LDATGTPCAPTTAPSRSTQRAAKESIQTWRNKARLLSQRLGRHEEALVACDHALALDAAATRGWALKAEILRALGDEHGARTAEERAVTLADDEGGKPE